ncbi:L-selectin-like isoform X2 [Cololabis saira]|uniref:L-selectin-like isoform X2 n=1 Tax=Cololabis saira TaxID=129043 RepID=UPI002AD5AC05|nr:L-selectin-like isoform X2 [Cololabis saira]
MKWTAIFILSCSLAETTFGLTYHFSKVPMNWTESRKWCRDNFTDLVVIQNQTENDYLVSLLPDRNTSPYYWIGITKKRLNDTWKWIGNNSTWMGKHSWAANEPNNNYENEFCVELYVNNGPNRGKWNDEKCEHKKYAVCYEAQCNGNSCENGKCVETINHTICNCDPGFQGGRCETAVKCPPLSQPDNGNFSCSEGSLRFNTTCQFKCSPGFFVNGSSDTTCNATGFWSSQISVCPDYGHLNCSEGGQTFNTTCQFKCPLGFFMIGSSDVSCTAAGQWSGPRPVCLGYKRALMAVAGCGTLSSFLCICFCWMKRRKRKKVAQERQPEDPAAPPSDLDG